MVAACEHLIELAPLAAPQQMAPSQAPGVGQPQRRAGAKVVAGAETGSGIVAAQGTVAAVTAATIAAARGRPNETGCSFLNNPHIHIWIW